MLAEISSFFKKRGNTSKFVIAGIVLILLIFYSLMGIIYRNYNINKQIRELEREIATLERDSIEQESKILYYGTDAYIEKKLREKLGYQKEGETVYALPRQDPEREKLIEEQRKYQDREEGKANILKWYDFFFKNSQSDYPTEN